MPPQWVCSQDLQPSHCTPSSLSRTSCPHTPHRQSLPTSNSPPSKLELESDEMSSNPLELKLEDTFFLFSTVSFLSKLLTREATRGVLLGR